MFPGTYVYGLARIGSVTVEIFGVGVVLAVVLVVTGVKQSQLQVLRLKTEV